MRNALLLEAGDGLPRVLRSWHLPRHSIVGGVPNGRARHDFHRVVHRQLRTGQLEVAEPAGRVGQEVLDVAMEVLPLAAAGEDEVAADALEREARGLKDGLQDLGTNPIVTSQHSSTAQPLPKFPIIISNWISKVTIGFIPTRTASTGGGSMSMAQASPWPKWKPALAKQ